MHTAPHVPRAITVGAIASELGEPIHRVMHVLRTRQYIRPVARAGVLRLFDRESVTLIRAELRKIDAERAARRGRAA